MHLSQGALGSTEPGEGTACASAYLHKTSHTDMAPGRARGQGPGSYACEAAGAQAHRLWSGTQLSRALFFTWIVSTTHGAKPSMARARALCQAWGDSLGAEGCLVSRAQAKGSR